MNLWLTIIADVIATTTLKVSKKFTPLLPSLFMVFGYDVAFYFMPISLHILPVGSINKTSFGVGILLISILGFVVYEQKLDNPAILSLIMIIVGVALINLFSTSVSH